MRTSDANLQEMGIMAPTRSDYLSLTITALTSYNRPFVLVAVFTFTFVILLITTKNNWVVSLAISILVALIVAGFFVFSFLSSVRF